MRCVIYIWLDICSIYTSIDEKWDEIFFLSFHTDDDGAFSYRFFIHSSLYLFYFLFFHAVLIILIKKTRIMFSLSRFFVFDFYSSFFINKFFSMQRSTNIYSSLNSSFLSFLLLIFPFPLILFDEYSSLLFFYVYIKNIRSKKCFCSKNCNWSTSIMNISKQRQKLLYVYNTN